MSGNPNGPNEEFYWAGISIEDYTGDNADQPYDLPCSECSGRGLTIEGRTCEDCEGTGKEL